MSWRRALSLLAVAALVAIPANSCSDSCGDVNCGSGVALSWRDEDLPAGVAAVQLCVDGVCEEPEPPTGTAAPGSAPRVEDITVELRLLDADAGVVDTWVWTGDREGDCCPFADLVEMDGELVPKQQG